MNIKLDPILRRMREVDDSGTGFPVTANDGDIMMWSDTVGAWAKTSLVTLRGKLGIPNPDETSYNNPGGMGNRQSIIIATTNITESGFNINKLINGTTANETEWNGSTAGSYLRFQLESPKIITEMKFYMSNPQDNGVWKVQGSDDGVTWTDIGSQFAFNTTPLTIDLSANATRYLYYQLLGVSGTLGTVHYEQEIEFKISR